jgi:hypothetical protein
MISVLLTHQTFELEALNSFVFGGKALGRLGEDGREGWEG